MRDIPLGLAAARVFLQGDPGGELPGRSGLEAGGVRVAAVPGSGHDIMFDRPEAFAAAAADRGGR
ncbi:hypothetical protein ABZ719_06585 [Streptomyces sp. NPDC006743]|uniref:hypothetical protein n=1 Tax=Streptomyces sp. NPDC006743 TaxID=3154480 RepID=UPI003452D830